MSSRAHPANTDLTPTDPGSPEDKILIPIGVLPVLIIDGELTQSVHLPNHEHSEPPEPYEVSTTDEVSPTLEAAALSDQLMEHVDKDPPPVVSMQANTMPMEAAASRQDQGESPLPYPGTGNSTTQRKSSLRFSSPYLLSRALTIDPYNESLRHEADIALAERRIQRGQNMFIQRVVELVNGFDTLFARGPQPPGV